MDRLDPNEIYDPQMRCVPRTKLIFKITKEARTRSISAENNLATPYLADDCARSDSQGLCEMQMQAEGLNLFSTMLAPPVQE